MSQQFSLIWLYLANYSLNIGLALLLGYALSSLIWQWTTSPLPYAAVTQSQASTANINSTVSPQGDLQSLLAQNWFGQAKAINNSLNSPIEQAITVAPETRLQLELQGTLASNDARLSTAIIAGPDGKGKTYQAQNTLPSGAVLQHVYADKVILRRQQGSQIAYETLKMKKVAARLTTVSPRLQPTATFSPNQSHKAKSLGDYRQQLLSNPAQFAEWVNFQAVQDQGQFTGYVLRTGKDKQFLNQLGLRSGDIVTAVNGESLSGALQGLKVLQNLKTATQLQLEILRNGAPLSFSFQF